MKNFLKKALYHISEKLRLGEIKRDITALKWIAVDDYLQRYLYQNPKYQEPKRLNKYEYKIYSQSGEDGIVEEIFNRIGTKNKIFIEFGVSDGFENNTLNLLTQEWTGFWIEGNKKNADSIVRTHQKYIESNNLTVKSAFITAENIEELFLGMDVPREVDLLSIDVDGNDYWIWKAIKNYNPRVVAIEYNGIFPPTMARVVRYYPEYQWGYSGLYGSPLKAFELLAKEKGYSLVGCVFLGNNAFFIRNDLLKDKFLAPYTAEIHYEPSRLFLLQRPKYERALYDSEQLK